MAVRASRRLLESIRMGLLALCRCHASTVKIQRALKCVPWGPRKKIPKRESFVRIMKSALAVVCACPHVRILVYARSIGMSQSICSTSRLAMLRFLPIRGILLRNAPSAIREFRRVKRQLVWCFVLAELAFGAISMIPILRYRRLSKVATSIL